MSSIRTLLKCTHGHVALMFAIALPLLLMIVGGAVSVSQTNAVSTQTRNAAEAGALAGMAMPVGTDAAQRIDTARRVYNENADPNWVSRDSEKASAVEFSASDERVTVTANIQVPAMFTLLPGPDSYAATINASAVPADRIVPAAVDVVVGLDGGCGNEDEHHKLQSQTDSVRNLMNALRSSQEGRNLIYASAIWSGADQGGNNASHDASNLTESLEYVASRSYRNNANAHGGTSMPNVMNEMYNSRNSFFADARDQSVRDMKYRIAVIFEGAHHEYDALESQTNAMCSGMKANYDGVYVFLIDGQQEENNPCTRGRGNERKQFPGSGSLAYNIQYCQKAMPGISFPALMRSGTGSIAGTMAGLAQQIAQLKVKIPGGARLETSN